ncbi:MAG: response regulator transcription factor, partial [Pirellulales bacterium]|nr:response regulator transcription factor [Pirellulales bacterium]
MGIKYNLDAEGYRVTIVQDGSSALTTLDANANDVDLVILDLMLPGMSGYAVCEAIRVKDKNLPVLILSARTLAEDRARGFDVGANQYLTKPFDLDEFLSRVRNLLALRRSLVGQSPQEADKIAVLKFANASINFITFKVTVGNRLVRLTHLEMSLLRYFAENEGRVIPRSELLQNVWGLPGTLQTRAPDQFMSRLRKTFEPIPAQPKY